MVHGQGVSPGPSVQMKVQFHRATIYEQHVKAVADAVRSGWLTSGGKVQEFEEKFAKFVGAKHAVAVNSCTAALHLSLQILKVGQGDEVITSPITFASAVNVIEHVGATPVFADVLPEDLTIDPDCILKKITDKTKAIIATHFAGFPAHMNEIYDIADRHGIQVITDAAHAIETLYRGTPSGCLGKAACYSFYATKNITTGEGGMLTTDDDYVADRARNLRLHGMTKDAWDRYGPGGYKHWDIIRPGWKYNMSDIQAALGCAQLKEIDTWLDDRHFIWDEYVARLPAEISYLKGSDVRSRSAKHLFVVMVKDRDRVMGEIQNKGVGVGVHFRAAHTLQYYREKYPAYIGTLPVAERASETVLSLPFYPTLSTKDVQLVVDTLRSVL